MTEVGGAGEGIETGWLFRPRGEMQGKAFPYSLVHSPLAKGGDAH